MKLLWLFWLICFISFLMIEFDFVLGFTAPHFTKIYLKDFLCMPLVLGICLKALQFIKQDKFLILEAAPIYVLTLIYCIYFELLLPTFMKRYTADWWDILLYFLGASIFYNFQPKPKKKPSM